MILLTTLYNFIYIFKGLFLTLFITSVSLMIGILLGFSMGILIFIKFQLIDIINIKNNWLINKLPSLYNILDLYKRLTVNTPLITQLFIFTFIIPFNLSSFYKGLIVLGLNSAAHISLIILEALNNINELYWNTSISLGFKKFDAIKIIFIKMIIKNNKKKLFQEFTALLKESSILSFFGVREISSRSKEVSLEAYNYVPYMLFVSGLYFFIITISEYIYNKFFND